MNLPEKLKSFIELVKKTLPFLLNRSIGPGNVQGIGAILIEFLSIPIPNHQQSCIPKLSAVG